jgi:hypothetical protein
MAKTKLDPNKDPAWQRHFECCVCLSAPAAPLRLMHHGAADCGAVLCSSCSTHFPGSFGQRCPRCRAATYGQPWRDGLLSRLAADIDLPNDTEPPVNAPPYPPQLYETTRRQHPPRVYTHIVLRYGAVGDPLWW